MFPFHKDQREAMEMNPITSIIIEKSMKNHAESLETVRLSLVKEAIECVYETYEEEEPALSVVVLNKMCRCLWIGVDS